VRQSILYFGNAWFTENRTSSHHVARWLGRRHDLYYFECPGLRAPKGTARDIRKIFAQVSRAFGPPIRTADGVQVRSLLQLPFHRFAVVRRLNQALMMATVRWVMWREGISAPLVWCNVPHVAGLAGRIRNSATVYYCIDDYSAVPGVNAAAVRKLDRELTERANMVFVASETLLESKTRLNANTYHSPHGVDLVHFAGAQEKPGSLRELGSRRGPVVGFFGLVEDYIDLDLLDFLARERPAWTFLVIGRVAVDAARVPQRDNLLFIGPRPYESLPDYGRHFTAAMIPYRLTDFTFHANPLKLREYLAMGKPVVATRTPQTEKFADVIDVVDSREGWLSALDLAVSTPQTASMVRARIQRVQDTSWDSRLTRVWSTVERTLGSRLFGGRQHDAVAGTALAR
jgi:glycosyltransferase involved in cell wall biosynthesis